MSVIDGSALGYLLLALTLQPRCLDYDYVDKTPETLGRHGFLHC